MYDSRAQSPLDPLNEAVIPQEAQRFAWKQETGFIQSYHHIETGWYIHIDGPDGQFYNRNREPITAKEGLDFAMQTGQQHSHSQNLKVEKSIEYGYG